MLLKIELNNRFFFLLYLLCSSRSKTILSVFHIFLLHLFDEVQLRLTLSLTDLCQCHQSGCCCCSRLAWLQPASTPVRRSHLLTHTCGFVPQLIHLISSALLFFLFSLFDGATRIDAAFTNECSERHCPRRHLLPSRVGCHFHSVQSSGESKRVLLFFLENV